MSQSLPDDIKPSRRSTKIMREHQNRIILDFIKQGINDADIMTELKLKRRTFQRRLQAIRQQHMTEVLDSQQTQAKASLLRICQDKIRWLDMQAVKIIMNPKEKTFDRLQAMDRSRQYQIDIAKLSIEGPTIFQLVPRDGFHSGTERTASELRDTPILPTPGSATTTTTTTTEDPNRVA